MHPETSTSGPSTPSQPTGLEQFLFVALVYCWVGVLVTLTFAAIQAYTL